MPWPFTMAPVPKHSVPGSITWSLTQIKESSLPAG